MFYSGKKIGNYTLVKILGQGSFGEVWLATRETKFITTKVAVKLANSEQVDAESIKQEAVLWEQASGHPNVLPIIEADEYEGQILIVSEYAADGTLADLLNKRGFLPVKKAVEISIGILNGLEFLHSRQIIHRDIKPANILLQGEIPRLTDFGLSRAISNNSLSMSVSVNGTPYYMSPEAFNRKRNKQTDIWSFGVVLYKMLTGKMPFAGNDVAEVYASVFTKEPAPMSEHIPSVVREIVLKCLKKSPLERYQDAKEIREDLIRCQAVVSAEKNQQNYFPVAAEEEDEESFNVETAESFSLAAQTGENRNVESTNKELSNPQPKRKISYFKYAAAACVLLLSIFATGFYVLSTLKPIPFRKGDKFGYAKWSKELIIGAKYDLAMPLQEDRALVAVGKKDSDGKFTGKYGFIDHIGREIVSLEYDEAESFSGGLAKVAKLADGKKMFGFINRQGAVIIPPIYEDAQSYAENLAAVKRNGKWSVIDTKGIQILPFKYDWIGRFSDGLSVVRSSDKYGFIDASGNEVIAPVYDSADKFSNGSAPVMKDGQAFFIDKNGSQTLPFKYDAADKFSEGYAMVTLKGKSGFIDRNGAEWIPFKYEDQRSHFSEGLAAVKLNGKYGFIDNSGNIVIPFKFQKAEPIMDDLALVTTDDGKQFYIGVDGTEFYEP